MSFFSSKNRMSTVDNSKSPIKGEPFKYEDFTTEQLESLRGPSGLGDERLNSFMKDIQPLTSSVNYLRNGVENIVAVDINTIEFNVNTSYGHIGLTIRDHNPTKKYLSVVNFENIGLSTIWNTRFILAYSGNMTGGFESTGGTSISTMGDISPGTSRNSIIQFNTTSGTAANAILGVMTNSDEGKVRLKQKIYDISNLTEKEISEINWLTLSTNTLLKASFAEKATIADAVSYKGSSWQGKTWLTLGDSITSPGSYQKLVKDELGFGTIINKGVAGQGMGTMMNNVTAAELQSADLVTIYGALNHMFPNAAPIGLITDSATASTFIGQLKKLIESVLTIKPTVNLVIIGTHNAADEYRPDIYQPITGSKNVGDYVLAMGEVARYYGLPFIDMYGRCGFNAFNLMSYTSDGAHPNTLGYQRITKVLVGELQRIEAF